MLCPFVHFISKLSCSWSTFFTAQLNIMIQDQEIKLIPMYTVWNHAKSKCITSNLFFQMVAAVDISHCRDALIFTHGNDMLARNLINLPFLTTTSALPQIYLMTMITLICRVRVYWCSDFKQTIFITEHSN